MINNIVVIGTNEEDMALACNSLKAIGGGIVLCNGKEVTRELELPIAGLMSDKGMDYVMIKKKRFLMNLELRRDKHTTRIIRFFT